MSKSLLASFLVATLCALALSGQTLAQAQAPSRDPGKGEAKKNDPRPPFKWWTIDKYRQELKISAEQSAEIERIFKASMDRLRFDKDDFDREQGNFSQLMERPSVDDHEFQRAVDRLEMARYAVSKERTLMLVRIHSVLTPDQRKGLQAIRKRNDAERAAQH